MGSAVTDRRYSFAIRDSLAVVVVRAAVISVPRIVRIIMRRVISIVLGFRRANAVISVLNIGAAAKQKCKSHGADQREYRYNLSIPFPFSSHALGRSFDGRPFANAS